ncbi:MAG TPA: hypothetical protein VJI46_06235 [Candidatus Nanoarchaeia archaeon]|nr:hypothetical protein [Candidatus Nanoarchaeia archaeon]
MAPLFGAGKKEAKPSAAQQINSMHAQGMDDDTIIMNLQGQGYSIDEISDALGSYAPAPEMQMPSPAQMNQPMPQFQYQYPPPPAEQSQPAEDKIEEIAEAIIDEKWNSLVKDINKIVEWKDKVEARLTAIEQDIKDMKERFEALHTGILGKIGEYDTSIKDVGVEIKAMEKVFQKILPTFTENVNKMERLLKTK